MLSSDTQALSQKSTATTTAIINTHRQSISRTPLADIPVDATGLLNPDTASQEPAFMMDTSDDPPSNLLAHHRQSLNNPNNGSFDNIRRASLSSQISSRRSSNTSRRTTRRYDNSQRRRSDASNQTERRPSLPPLNFRPVDYTSEELQPLKPPAFDPTIYDRLSSFTFGSPPPASDGADGAPTVFRFVGQTATATSRVPKEEPRYQSASETETDEDERSRDDRAKLRAIDDGSRRPSLPINIPPGEGRDGRRSSAFKVPHSVDTPMHIDEEDTTLNGTGSLPVQLEPNKPLPSLPNPSALSSLSPRRRDAAPMHPSRGITNELAAVAATNGYDLSYIMDYTPVKPVISNANREHSPQPSHLDSAQFLQQAVLDLQDIAPWDVVRPSGAVDDAFARHVIENDVVYKTHYGSWTFKRNTNVVLKSSRHARTSPPPQSEPSSSTAEGLNTKGKEKSPEPQTRQATEGQLWECRTIGKYALSPGKTHLGENRRPYVLQGLTPEGVRRIGPAYLIHKHSRCHAFSIFQGFHVTGQKILASHAILLASKAVQGSYATTPETRSRHAPHEPYEDDPEVQRLQTHNLVDDEPHIPRARTRHRGQTIHATAPSSTAPPMGSSPRSKTILAKVASEVQREQQAGPSTFQITEVDKTRIAELVDKEGSTATMSTLTPMPKPTPHSVAFHSVDPHALLSLGGRPEDNSLARGGSGKGLDWVRRAFGQKSMPNVPNRGGTIQHGPPSASIDIAYSPPWLLMQPQSVRQEEDRIIKNLNDSFRAVGLIPPAKGKPSPAEQIRKRNAQVAHEKEKEKANKPTSSIIESIPENALMMLLPLWVEEGLSDAGIAKHHTPIQERTYLLVYYVSFDSGAGEKVRSTGAGRKRPRHGRSREHLLRRPVSHSAMAISTSTGTGTGTGTSTSRSRTVGGSDSGREFGHARTHSEENGQNIELKPPQEQLRLKQQLQQANQVPTKPKKVSFRVVARMLSYMDVRECGVKLPRYGLAVDAPLSDALVGNPQYHAAQGSFSAVVGVCHSIESGLELLTDGLDRLGLRHQTMQQAEEQQTALLAMSADRPALQEEMNAHLQPPTPIGKSVIEAIFSGCISVMEHGF